MVPSSFPRKSAFRQGVAAVEMAILLPLLVLIFTGMIEYGRLVWHYDALAKATRDAARYLADETAPITPAMQATAKGMVGDAAAAAGVEGLVPESNVAASCAPNCNNPETVTVAVAYSFSIGGWVPVFGKDLWTVTMSPHTTMRYMR